MKGPLRAAWAVRTSAALALTGIALAVVDQPELAAWLTVGALVGLLYSVHSFGRLGPDEPGTHG